MEKQKKLHKIEDQVEDDVDIAEMGKHHPKNSLNDLTGKLWIQFTKTWFIYNGPRRKKDELLHPAKYPEGMIVDFIKFFTKSGETVLDPFLGTGSTLVAAYQTGRNGIGIELMEKYAKIAKKRVQQSPLNANVKQKVITGNSLNIDEIWSQNNLPFVDFIICSPPYWNMLTKSRGGVISAQKARQTEGLDTVYSDSSNDLGNEDNYKLFIRKLGSVFQKASKFLRDDKYIVIIIQNLRDMDGSIKTLAWDITKELETFDNIKFQGEKIWCQDDKKLGIWGYPKIFIPNYHHHYCLIFKKTKKSDN